MNDQPTLIDLFSGAGGMSHGFEQAGYRVLAGVDWDEDSLNSFALNHQGARTLKADLASMTPQEMGEALRLEPGGVDVVAGGPPCQGFSRNRAFRHQDGSFVDDPRNHLYWHFFEYVGFFRPKVVVMENVPEILIKQNGYFKEAVFERFASLGYAVEAKVLNAADYGVPQRRRRAIFLAGRDGVRVRHPEPTTVPGVRAGKRTPTSRDRIETKRNGSLALPMFAEDRLASGPSVWDAIGDLHGSYADELHGDARYASAASTDFQRARRHEGTLVRNHFPWPLSERQLSRIRLLKPGQGQAHLPAELQTAEGYGSAYRRMDPDAQALTITTWMFHPGSGMFTHPFDDRVVTIREAARLQSFQDRFIFTGRYHSQCRQVGNAVAPLVAHNIACSVADALGQSPGTTPARV